jgi:P-type conjugative transfer ATPase TrbB
MFIDTPASESQTRRADALRSALGPLMALLADDRVVEIMVNADGGVWVDRLGEGQTRTAVRMAPLHVERMLRLVASEMRLELNAEHPSLSAKLPPPWSARLQAAIPPIVAAPAFALRMPARRVFSLEDCVRAGILSPAERDALAFAVHARDNILIGGGTGSGKTTLANALVQVIARDTTDRVHIIEDTPEIQCEAPNKLQILVQPGVHSWRDAIMAAMRFRPDRILVGEVRDGSALELLKAWNTGHPGGLATIHANDTRSMLDRVCQLIEEVVYPRAPGAGRADDPGLRPHSPRHHAPPRAVAFRGSTASAVAVPTAVGNSNASPDRPHRKGLHRDLPSCVSACIARIQRPDAPPYPRDSSSSSC